MDSIDRLGRIGASGIYYRVTGQQDLDYKMKVVITDFRGEAWTALFSLQDFMDSEGLAGLEPEPEELLAWIGAALGGQATALRRTARGIAGLEAPHKVPGLAQPLRLQLPPTGACERAMGAAAHDEMHDFAGALYGALASQSDALRAERAARAAEREQAARVEARAGRLEAKLREVRPDIYLAPSGSFKRRSMGGSDRQHEEAAAAAVQALEEQPAADAAPEDRKSVSSPKARVGAAVVVPRRGRGRAGFAARIRRS